MKRKVTLIAVIVFGEIQYLDVDIPEKISV